MQLRSTERQSQNAETKQTIVLLLLQCISEPVYPRLIGDVVGMIESIFPFSSVLLDRLPAL